MNLTFPARINKYLAHNNYATRKGADELIEKGCVTINGKRARLGDIVQSGDKVEVSLKGPKKKYVYYAYNKAAGVSTNPEKGVKDILKVAKFPERVFPIGRLDVDSHGLIIMTNDGRVTDRLLSPKYVHDKEYVVKTENPFNDEFIKKMGAGVHFDKFVSRKCEVWRKSKDTFHIILTEGKKRQIRRMCEALHQKVINLRRIRIMNIEIGKLPDNGFRKIEGKELETFLKSLKLI